MSSATSSTGGTGTDLDAALARAIRHLIAEAASEPDPGAGAGQAAAGESAAA